MGCVLPAGQGQAPARQASRGAGLPDAAGCTTVNKMCGSGMKAAMFAHDMLIAGTNRVMVAGGMESMTNAPYLLPKARSGYRLGHDRVIDSMFLDGLEDAYDRGRLMGTFAEDAAQAYQFSRAEQDAYALASLTRALKAGKDGSFAAEIAPVTVKGRKGDVTVAVDEQPLQGAAGKDPDAETRFSRGRHGDGGQFLLDLRRRGGAGADAAVGSGERGALKPLATILGHSTFAGLPSKFPSAPVGAIRALLDKVGWKAGDVDLWEVNEAFAVVAMIAMRELGLPA